MIEVEVHYRHKKVHNKNNDYFIYPYFMVKGHANNGTHDDNLRVCGGISACIIGIQRLIDYGQYNVVCQKGLFEISSVKASRDDCYIDMDTNYALNTLLCQLYDLRNMYPNQFSRFDMIDIKESEENHERTKKPKPFRKLKDHNK